MRKKLAQGVGRALKKTVGSIPGYAGDLTILWKYPRKGRDSGAANGCKKLRVPGAMHRQPLKKKTRGWIGGW